MVNEYDEDYVAYIEEQEALKREEEYLLEQQAREQREKEISDYEKHWY